jgi:hypothetical protein
MRCPKCLSANVRRDSGSKSPGGPLSEVVLHFECPACRHTFYRANPGSVRSHVRHDRNVPQQRAA